MQLYVGNMNYNMTENAMREIFSGFGNVDSAKIIIDRETGRSKGFGFIEMSDNAEAREAIAQLDGSEVEGRNIKVNEAKQKPQRDNRF